MSGFLDAFFGSNGGSGLMFDTDYFLHFVFSPSPAMLKGMMLTVIAAVISQLGGVTLGGLLAIAGLSRSRFFRSVNQTYIFFFRGTPVLVQLVLIYFGLPYLLGGFDLFPARIHVGPFNLPGALVAGIVTFMLHEAAYMSEIIRAGILSIEEGQEEASKSLGMSPATTMAHIILPQAIRVIIPPLGNQFNQMLKNHIATQRDCRAGNVPHRRGNAIGNLQKLRGLSRCFRLLSGPHGYMDHHPVPDRAPFRTQPQTDHRHGSVSTMTQQTKKMDRIVECANVVAGFGDKAIVKGVDLDVMRGEVVAIIGPSGSGKTTFLRCINHLHPISQGFIRVDGDFVGYEAREDGLLHPLPEKKIAPVRRQIGFVFQRFNLFPHRTALGNVTEAPVRVLKMSRDEANERGKELLRRVGLGDKFDSYPSALSGGQLQRVAIARAPCHEPENVPVRRAHQRPRPGNGRRSDLRDQGSCKPGHDHDRGQPRDAFCARDQRPRRGVR
nr:ABC transporter permease subunit [uncultured Cohaesibacter sp.]